MNNRSALIIIGMITIAIANACLRLWGNWWTFGWILFGQLLMTNSVYSYLYKKTIYLGAISIDLSTNPSLRKFTCAAALLGYLILFLKS